ncbi:DNA translocase FtsK [Rhodococcoides fascians]|uniref:DNA translocase FtsK n=1 Tax=Rhodococcoides fascians TaxID=1828 RepID=UPI000522F0BE|nr:DNA translocase FtsK [Rhodococcus fascians]
MTETLEPFLTTVTVGTNDLRHALVSVARHASAIPEISSIYRIRLQITRDQVYVIATDRFSAALARVTVIAPGEPNVGTIDLTPENVKEVIAVFKPGKEKDDEPEWLTQIETDDTHVILTDVSGMIDGKSIAFVRTPVDDGFPSIDISISRALAGEPVWLENVHVDGSRIALFESASRQYNRPLTIEARSGTDGLVISCGRSFLGLCMPNRSDEELDAQWVTAMQHWRSTLPDPRTPLNVSKATRDSGASDVPVQDDILGDAVALIQSTQKCTRGHLQKRLRISAKHADEVLGELEQLGVVSEADEDDGNREVLIRTDGSLPDTKDGA